MSRPNPRTPITILSGFLGSGKTTLLNGLLRRPDFADTAVIVNELGEIGLDDLLITAAPDEVVLLSSGCLCCALGNSLRDTLLDLNARRSTGQLPPFQRVVVETTGLADPAPIIQSLLRDPLVTSAYQFQELVTVVDALFGESQLQRHVEARQQVSLADRLVVSKRDLAPEETAARLTGALRSFNPLASITAGRGPLDAHELDFAPLSPEAVRRRVESSRDAGANTLTAGSEHHRHPGDVRADAFVVERPIGWSGVAAWVDAARTFFGAGLLRCKGLLDVDGASGPVLIQGVQDVFAPPETLGGWPSDDRRSRLVCISQGVDPDLLRVSLAILHIERGAHRPSSVAEMRALAASC